MYIVQPPVKSQFHPGKSTKHIKLGLNTNWIIGYINIRILIMNIGSKMVDN